MSAANDVLVKMLADNINDIREQVTILHDDLRKVDTTKFDMIDEESIAKFVNLTTKILKGGTFTGMNLLVIMIDVMTTEKDGKPN